MTYERDDFMTEDSSTKWICVICGYECDAFEAPEMCPVCGAGPDDFERCAAGEETRAPSPPSGEYLSQWAKKDDLFEAKFSRVSDLAKHGRSEISAMRTQKSFPDWDAILFKGAQLHRMPINEEEEVDAQTVIGKTSTIWI